jgi:hypothetical protein
MNTPKSECNAAAKTVHLWDGKDYPSDHVDRQYAELLSYRDSHATLEAHIDHKDIVTPSVWRATSVGACAILSIASYFDRGPQANEVPVLYSQCVAIAYLLLHLLTETRFCLKRFFGFPREMRVHDAQVEVSTRWRKRTFKLSECYWFLGDTRQDEDGEMLRLTEAVVLQLPGGRNIAVIAESEARLVWIQFLTLASVLHLKDLNSRQEVCFFYRCIAQGTILGALLGLVVGAIFATFAERGPIQVLLAQSTVAAMSGFVLGWLRAHVIRRPCFPKPATYVFAIIASAKLGWIGAFVSGLRGPISLVGLITYSVVAFLLMLIMTHPGRRAD